MKQKKTYICTYIHNNMKELKKTSVFDIKMMVCLQNTRIFFIFSINERRREQKK